MKHMFCAFVLIANASLKHGVTIRLLEILFVSCAEEINSATTRNSDIIFAYLA